MAFGELFCICEVDHPLGERWVALGFSRQIEMVILYPLLPMPNPNATILRNADFRFIQDSKPQSPYDIWRAENLLPISKLG